MGKSIDHVKEFEPIDGRGPRSARRDAGARRLIRETCRRHARDVEATPRTTRRSRRDAPRRDRVQSLDRALDVLEALAAAGRARGLGRGRAHGPGGEHRAPAAREPRGPRLRAADLRARPLRARAQGARARGGHAGAHRRALRRRAAAPRARRAASTGETTNLVVLDGDRVVYVDQVPGRHSVRMFTELGSSALAHTTGSGKAMLAQWPPETIAKLYPRAREPFERLTPRTHATLASLDGGLRAHPRARLRARRRGARAGRQLRRRARLRRRRDRLRGDQHLGADHADRPRRPRAARQAAAAGRPRRCPPRSATTVVRRRRVSDRRPGYRSEARPDQRPGGGVTDRWRSPARQRLKPGR